MWVCTERLMGRGAGWGCYWWGGCSIRDDEKQSKAKPPLALFILLSFSFPSFLLALVPLNSQPLPQTHPSHPHQSSSSPWSISPSPVRGSPYTERDTSLSSLSRSMDGCIDGVGFVGLCLYPSEPWLKYSLVLISSCGMLDDCKSVKTKALCITPKVFSKPSLGFLKNYRNLDPSHQLGGCASPPVEWLQASRKSSRRWMRMLVEIFFFLLFAVYDMKVCQNIFHGKSFWETYLSRYERCKKFKFGRNMVDETIMNRCKLSREVYSTIWSIRLRHIVI